MTIGFLVSGHLGYKTITSCSPTIVPEFIATDSKSVEIAVYAKENKIRLFIGNPRNGKLNAFLKGVKIDILLSINYLFLIDPDIIEKAKYPINFHGSLLPAYRGRTPHVWSIINNENISGITAHIIDKDCDTGDIVLQTPVNIDYNDTGADILLKYELIYPEMIDKILTLIKKDNLIRRPQDHSQASFFGKRTSTDGEINWNWQKERIRNWVRAQANPYPGAFSLFNNQKIIIDKLSFSSCGYMQNDPDGLVLKGFPNPIIKTPNGAVKLESIRTNEKLVLKNVVLGK